MKRILSGLLAVCMVLSMLVILPFSSSAANDTTIGIVDEQNTIGYKAVTATVTSGTDLSTVTAASQIKTGTTYIINSAAGITALKSLVAGGATFNGVSIYLTADVKVTTSPSIGTAEKPFQGKFYGQSKKLTMSDTSGTAELFTYINGNAVVQDLRLAGSNSRLINTAQNNVKVHNVWTSAGITYAAASNAAVVANTVPGNAGDVVTITNCTNTGSITTADTKTCFVGGFVGYAKSDVLVENCRNTGAITAGEYVGGIVGFAGNGTNATSVVVRNCVNRGALTVGSFAGGIVGCATSTPVTIENCTNEGVVAGKGTAVNSKCIGGIMGQANDVTISYTKNASSATVSNVKGGGSAPGEMVGGIIGNAANNAAVIDHCVNEAAVNSTDGKSVGGIVGQLTGGDATKGVTYCTNSGKVTATPSASTNSVGFVGGIVGKMANVAKLDNCTNTGDVTATDINGIGGIVSSIDVATSITNCTNTGAVTGKASATGSQSGGGIVGKVNADITIDNCTNSGAITVNRQGALLDYKGGQYAGGIIGVSTKGVATIKNCKNAGAVWANGRPEGYTSSFSGGMIGAVVTTTITSCENTGSIYGISRVGGIIGQSYGGGPVSVTDCVNYGSITAEEIHAGGIHGYAEAPNGNGNSYSNCKNYGTVASYHGNAAGIVSTGCHSVTIDNCINGGNITGGYVGGIIAQKASKDYPISITNCINYSPCNGTNTLYPGIWARGNDDASSITYENNKNLAPLTTWVGFQVNNPYTEGGVEYQDMRLVATIDSLEYAKVGFNVTVTNAQGTVVKTIKDYDCKYVYTELKAGETECNITAEEYRPGGYLYSLTIKKIPVSQGKLNFKVETYAVMQDGLTAYGQIATYSHTVGHLMSYQGTDFNMVISDPILVFQAPVDNAWGHWQFPKLSNATNGSIVASWSFGDDTIYENTSTTTLPKTAVSKDGGLTWIQGESARTTYTAPTKDGFYFVGFQSQSGVKLKKADVDAHSAPVASGYSGWQTQYLWQASSLKSLHTNLNQGFKMQEFNPSTGETRLVDVAVNWPYMPVYANVSTEGGVQYYNIAPVNYLMAINSRYGIMEKDGVLYYATYSRGFNSAASRITEAYSSILNHYYSCYVFTSTNGGRTWNYASQVSVTQARLNSNAAFADVKDQEGLCEPSLEIMPDGSFLMVMRSGGDGKADLIVSRSTDNCKTWSEPTSFADYGVLPQLCRLDCGVTLASYGRPEIWVRATNDPTGVTWRDPVKIALSPYDANKTGAVTGSATNGYMTHLSCCYTEILPINRTQALLIYSDFNYPYNSTSVSKAIMVRIISIEPK